MIKRKNRGFGYLTYYENWNEPDKTWEGLDSYFSPYELAAMCSADYDGHEGKLGDTYGIKNADPNSKLVMGGLANPRVMPQYLDLMKLWFENNREDKKMAFDVINFHTYCGTSSPEEAGLKQICEDITTWRNLNARDKEVWLTEFGWDTNPKSGIAAPSEEAQKNYLIRGYLIAMAAGVDRSTMYMVRDAGHSSSTGKYGTSGFTTEKGSWKKKPSWYGTYALKDTLSGYKFKEVIKEDANIYIYKFIKEDTGEECYAIWSPTSDGSHIDNYEIDVTGKTKATLIELKDGYNDGQKTRLKIENGKIKVDVSESPILVNVGNIDSKYSEPTKTRINVDKSMIKAVETGDDKINIGITNSFNRLFDEQKQTPAAPTMNYTGTTKTAWAGDDLGNNYPVSVIIDLGENYRISNIGIYDTNSTGNIKFYAGDGTNFEEKPFLEYGLNYYNTWRLLNTNITTRYIKIVKEDTANLNEIAIYGYAMEEMNEDPNYDLNNPVTIDKIESDVYSIDDKYIYKINSNTTLGEFRENIKSEGIYEIYDNNLNKVTNTNILIGTGMKIMAGKLQYELVVTGDTDGNGRLTITDLAKLKMELVNLRALEAVYRKAADMNFDSNITTTDLSKLKWELIK